MVPRSDRRTWWRDAGVALAVYAVLLAVMRLPLQPLQGPGYVLLLGFDAVQNPLAPGLGGGAFQVAFGGYLLALAALAGAVADRLRRRFGPAGPLRYGVAGAVLAFLLYAVAVLGAMLLGALPTAWSQVAAGLLVGLGGLWVGWRLGAIAPRAGRG